MLTEHDWPRAHLVMDDFFPSAALGTIFKEIRTLESHMKPGLVRDIGHDGQSVFFEHQRRKNKAVWIHEPAKTLTLFREQLWSAPLVEMFDQAREPLFQIIPNCWTPHLQVSSYMTGDHYDFHEDEGAGVNLTAIVFLAAAPKKVRGGDLVLSYEGEETTIPFEHNRLVIFPSRTLHRVTRVRVASDDARDARISLQSWLTYGKPEVQASGENARGRAKAQKRAPEADRPTFLLAEEPILAAAQAMSASADQSPEDLYWGAFYLSRILSANIRSLVAEESALTVSKTRIRRVGSDVEVYGIGRWGRKPVRVGFLLLGPATPAAEALSLFLEVGRGATKTRARCDVPAGADEAKTRALLRRLLTRAASRAG